MSNSAKSSPAEDEFALGCTCFYLRSATRRATQIYDEALKAAGLTVNQYSLLSKLSRNGGVSVSRFAEIMSMDRTTLTRNLQPLQAAGWIASGGIAARVAPPSPQGGGAAVDTAPSAVPGAGRMRLLTLTDAGEAKLIESIPLWRAAQTRINELLGHETQRGLHRLLKEAVRTLESHQPLGS